MNYLTKSQFNHIQLNPNIYNLTIHIPEEKRMWLNSETYKGNLSYRDFQDYKENEFNGIYEKTGKFVTSVSSDIDNSKRVYVVVTLTQAFTDAIKLSYVPPATNLIFEEPFRLDIKDSSGAVIFKKLTANLYIDNLHKFIQFYEKIVNEPFLVLYDKPIDFEDAVVSYMNNKQYFDKLFGDFINNMENSVFEAGPFTLTLTKEKQ